MPAAAALASDLPRLIEITGRLLVTETVNEARLEVAAGAGSHRVQFSAVLDGATTPICRHLDGKIFWARGPHAHRFTPPLHINCRSIWIEVGDDEVGAVDAFDPHDPELPELVKTGHFIDDKEKYAPLRVPASPGSRDFIFRRGAAGEAGTLDWKRPRYAIEGLKEGTVQSGVEETGARFVPLGLEPPTPTPPVWIRDTMRVRPQRTPVRLIDGSDVVEVAPAEPQPTHRLPEPPTLDGPAARQRLADLRAEADREAAELDRQIADARARQKSLQKRQDAQWRRDVTDPELTQRIAEGADRIVELSRQRGQVQQRMLERWRETVLLHPSDAGSRVRYEFARTTKTARETRRSAAEEFRRMVRGGTGLDGRTVPVANVKRGERRAYCTRAGSVHLSSRDEARTVIHELGHALEFSDATVRQQALDFLDRRTAGEEPRRLRDITGNRGYGANEVAREDEFIHPYMGKDYGGGFTEIVSMGCEHIYAEPERLARDDPEYFDFVWSILRGGQP